MYQRCCAMTKRSIYPLYVSIFVLLVQGYFFVSIYSLRGEKRTIYSTNDGYVYSPANRNKDDMRSLVSENECPNQDISINTVIDKGTDTGTIMVKPQASSGNVRLKIPLSDPYNDEVVLPAKDIMSNMVHEQLTTLYHRYVNSLQALCHRVTRLGKLSDGGWDVCADHRYLPANNCLVYSFGFRFNPQLQLDNDPTDCSLTICKIKDDFSFDDMISKNYDCEVHSFDPSTSLSDHRRSNKITFHAYGLGTKEDVFMSHTGVAWKMKSLMSFKKFLGHSERRLDVLKIDIEQWEWSVLPEIINSGGLHNVNQLLMEFHVNFASNPVEPTREKYLQAMNIYKDLYDLGFRIFWTHRNMWCKFKSRDGFLRTGCHEISFIRV